MMNLKYEDIINKIKEEKGLSDEEITSKIKEKLDYLSDLISKEGAAHIVANELGVNVLNIIKNHKINELIAGMGGVNVISKVLKIYGVREFKTPNREGKVANLLIGDETSLIRLVLWDTNHIKEIEDDKIKEGTVIEVKNGYVRENNSYRELHVGNRGELVINPEGKDVDVKEIKQFSDFSKKEIKDLTEDDREIKIHGTIVQLFEPRFYDACPECGIKVIAKNQCSTHGNVIERQTPVMNFVLDDGTGNIRAVAFRNNVQQVLSLNEQELLELKDKFEEVKREMLGKQLAVVGRVTRNNVSGANEFVVQRVVELNPEDLLKEAELVES